MSRSGAYAKAGVWSLVAHAAQLVGSVALSVIVVRMLAVEELGELALGRQMAALLAVVGSLALERTIVRFVPELAERGEPGAARRLILSLFRLRLLAGAVVAALAILLRGPIASLVGIQDPGVVVVAALGAIGFSVAAHLRAAANGWFESRRVAQAAVLTVVLTFVATVLALRAGYGVLTIIGVGAVAVLVGAAWTWPTALGPGGPDGPGTDRARLVKYTVPFAAIVLMNQLVHSQTEVFFLGRLRGPEDAAYFQYGFVLAQRLIDFLPLALWEVSMAAFAREQTAGERDLREVVHRYLRLSYTAILPVAVIGVVLSPALIALLYGVVLSPALIALLYGEKMQASAMVAQAYFVLGALAAFGAPMGMVLYAREATGLVLRIYVVATVVNLGLDWWLVSRFGLGGAVAGLAVAKMFLVVMMSVAAATRIGGISVPVRAIAKAGLASSGALAWWVIDPGVSGIQGLALGTVFCVAVILALYRVFRVVSVEDGQLLAATGFPGSRALARALVVGRGNSGL